MVSTNDIVNTISKYINLRQNNDEIFIKLAKDGHVELVEAFIKLGTDIHVNNDQALRLASNNGHLAVVEHLINNGAGLSASPSMALEPAAALRPDKVGDIHAENDLAFRWASENGHLAVVECLIKHGADRATPNLGVAADIHAGLALPRPDKVGRNDWALCWASRNGHLAVVKCLIAHGAEGLRHSWRCS
jgi:ankyrin repeat protein